jgi:hypothetical protein
VWEKSPLLIPDEEKEELEVKLENICGQRNVRSSGVTFA